MSNRNYPPAYLRYLKARLWNLGRPGFWITAILLSVVGLGIREYWLNPDFFTQKQNDNEVARQQPTDSSLSDEDQAIAADIDNLPVLLNDSEQANLATIANTPKENARPKKNKSLFPNLLKQPSSGNNAQSNLALGMLNGVSAPKEQNPFVLQADNLLQIGNSYGNSQSLGVKSSTASAEQTGTVNPSSSPGIGLPTPTDNSQNAVVISPLQAAINQSTNQNISGVNSAIDSQAKIMGNASYGATTLIPPTNTLPNPTLPTNNGFNATNGYNQPTVTSLPQNSYTNFNNNQTLPNLAAVTQPITSAAPNNIAPYSLQNPNQNAATPTYPAASGNYDNSALQQSTQIPQSNVSRPRPTAGSYGGIEINGYKYP
ncbi:hypothetical protein [Calothrix sp. PCC 7507]|uniref:hypothetical protein n=1 Tax=Calothrix sp. PCC 7507 TaxID=99598 RepID=UPI00029EED66|nr:hypothetical protein [Calothrix sp. PCC 7507]AFY36386.1 hypothetical protein Cal7507_6085 [Calothrix sp. PCC 7507]